MDRARETGRVRQRVRPGVPRRHRDTGRPAVRARLDDPVAVLRYLNQVAVDGAASGAEDRIQGSIDEAVAKTVNLPAAATDSDVYHVFQAAWEAGCKGITVYRDGSRSSQPKAL